MTEAIRKASTLVSASDVTIDKLNSDMPMGFRTVSRVKTVRVLSDYSVELDIKALNLSDLDCINTATFLSETEHDAKTLYEKFSEAKRMDWAIVILAPYAWANGQGGCALHDCTASITRIRWSQYVNQKL
ncbi:hypothetical protein [Alteromonas gracilis]|uniref:hypothetical protein n=1 Tax=Alteromonas gracilis TaxID=1479524 RepID=UPI0030D03421